MNITKNDGLLIYRVLHHYLTQNGSCLSQQDKEHILTVSGDLHNYLLDATSSHDSDDYEVHDDDAAVDIDDSDDEDDEVTIEVDDVLSASALEDLVSAEVISPDGQVIDLEFEKDETGETVIDALLDEGTVVIENIEIVKIVDNTISLFDGGEWHDFKFVKRVPKSWSRIIKPGLTYEVKETK